MATRKGLDYSWGRPDLGQVKAAGFTFVMRYVSPYAGSGKNANADEVRALRGAGLGLGLVFESYAARALEGRAAGKADGDAALAAARALGYPDSKPLYFAVDFDAAENQQGAIDEYLRGAADAIGAGRVGVYAGYWVCKRCKENGTAKWYWQTYAWSGGNKLDGMHVYQYRNGQTIGGAAVDFNEGYDDASLWLSEETSPAPAPEPTPAPNPGDTYTVKAGDTLGGIASRYGTTYQELARINNISDPNKIYPGQVLKLSGNVAPPATVPATSATYTVKQGDTLSGIAAKFGTTYQELARINNIADPNVIRVGQVLKVNGAAPVPPATTARTYTVVGGDTLGSIAARFGTSWQTLQALNNIPNANLIYPGQVLRLP